MDSFEEDLLLKCLNENDIHSEYFSNNCDDEGNGLYLPKGLRSETNRAKLEKAGELIKKTVMDGVGDANTKKRKLLRYCTKQHLTNCYSPCNRSGYLGLGYLGSKKCEYERQQEVNKSLLEMLDDIIAMQTSPQIIVHKLIVLFRSLLSFEWIKKIVQLYYYLNSFNILGKVLFACYQLTNPLLGKINSSLAGVFDISFLYTVIYAPVYEELVFRELPVGIEETFHIVVEWIGNYFSARDSAVSVMKKLITLFFMLLSSLLFGVVHTSNGYSNLDTFFQVSNCLVMGLLFYTLRKKFGRGASIIAHVLNNFLAFNSSLPFGLLVLLLVETIAGVRKILPSEVVYKLELFRKDINIVFKTFKDKVDSELESVWEGKMDLYGNRLDFEDEAIEQEVTIGDSFGISDEEAIMMEEGSRKIMNLLREMPTGGTPKKRKTKKRYTKKYLKQRVRISLLKS